MLIVYDNMPGGVFTRVLSIYVHIYRYKSIYSRAIHEFRIAPTLLKSARESPLNPPIGLLLRSQTLDLIGDDRTLNERTG